MDYIHEFGWRYTARFVAIFSLIISTAFAVACGDDEVATSIDEEDTYTVGGTVSGLVDEAITVELNGEYALELEEDGDFEFEAELDDGDEYEVVLVDVADSYECEITNGSGVIDGADIRDVQVDCSHEDETPEGAHFEVAVDPVASTLETVAGGVITVVAAVENVGDEVGTQDIVFELDGAVMDTVTVEELGVDELTEVSFDWQTDVDDVGDYTGSLSSDDDSEEFAVFVYDQPEEAYFVVTIDPGASTTAVDEGESVEVVAHIENIGDQAGTQDITLEIGGAVEDTAAVADLEPNTTTEILLQWVTEAGDAGNYTAVVASEDDDDTIDVDVAVPPEPAFFAVTIDETASLTEAEEGNSIVIDAVVENTGEVIGTQDVTLEIGGEIRDTIAVEDLEPANTVQVTLQWDTGAGDAGVYDAIVASEDDDDLLSIEVVPPPAPAFFEVTIDEVASTLSVEEGQEVIVVADVVNTGELSATQDVTFTVGGQLEDTEVDVTLDAAASQQLTFSWQTGAGDVGDHTVEVASDDDSDTATATVSPLPDAAYFTVTIDEAASTLTVDEGETVFVVATIENVGDLAGTQDITLEIGGFQEDIALDVTLDAGASDTLTLEWETAAGDAGSYEAVVASDDGSDSTTVTVFDPDAPGVLSGHVYDADPSGDMEGVEVLLFEVGATEPSAVVVAGVDGAYQFDDLEPGDYEIGLQAPGLEPNYVIEEVGENRITVTVDPGANEQDLTVEWLRRTDVIIDGGLLDLQYDDPDGDLAVPIPECEQQPDGSWEPQEIDTGSENVDVTFNPDDECFRIDDVGIDLLTGALDIDLANALFPMATVHIDDSDDAISEDVDSIEVDFEWLLDGMVGFVDFREGSMDIDFDYRILVGGVVHTNILNMSIPFGARDDEYDCQLTEAWGGNVNDPQLDENNEQIGDYLHDPIDMLLTTGTSGAAAGSPYDSELRWSMVVDNEATVGRLSEGDLDGGNNDPGGASCGELDLVGNQADFAATINELLELPADPGSVYGEFNLVLP